MGTPTANSLLQAGQDDNNWILPAKTYAGNRYTGLRQINKTNVGSLHLTWSTQIADDGQQETPPIAWNGRMYLSTAHGDLQAPYAGVDNAVPLCRVSGSVRPKRMYHYPGPGARTGHVKEVRRGAHWAGENMPSASDAVEQERANIIAGFARETAGMSQSTQTFHSPSARFRLRSRIAQHGIGLRQIGKRSAASAGGRR